MVPIELIKKLDSGDPESIKDAINQIGDCSDPRAIEYLEPLMKHKNVGVRYFTKKVIDRLIKLPVPQGPLLNSAGATDLSESSADDDNSPLPQVPATAFERLALARGKAFATETARENDEPASDALIEDFITKLDSKNSQDRLEAIFNLKRFVTDEVGLALLELCDHEKDPLVLSVLVKVLPDFHTCLKEPTVNRLTSALTSDDPRVRANAIEALEQIWFEHREGAQLPDIFKLVIPLVSDNDNRVKANALKFLFSFDRSLVLQELNNMIEESEIWMKDSALYALGEIRDSAVIPILLKAVSDPSEEIRLKAVGKLAGIGSTEALLPLSEIFVNALADERHEMNFIANMVLDRLGEKLEDSGEVEATMNILRGFLHCAANQGNGKSAARVMVAMLVLGAPALTDMAGAVELLMNVGGAQCCLNFYEPLFQTLLKSFPSEAARFAELCIMCGHFSRAMDIYEKVVVADPGDARNLYRLGEISLINGMYDRAVRSLDKSLELGGCSEPHARKLLAEACLRKGTINRAITESRECLRLCTEMEDRKAGLFLIYELAGSFAEAGQNTVALSMFRSLRDTEPDYMDVAQRIAQLESQSVITPPDQTPERSASEAPGSPQSSFADQLNLEEASTKILYNYVPDQEDSEDVATDRIPFGESVSTADEAPTVSRAAAQTNISSDGPMAAPGLEISAEEYQSIRERIDSRYSGLRLIGRGGMGLVFHARDNRLSREVALKVLPEYLCLEDEALARFLREAQAVARLNHFNLVQIYDIVIQQKFAYLVMEFIDGISVRQLLRKKGRLPLTVIRNIALQLCQALINAHDATVIHRDIKPDNLMVNRAGKLKVMDFGLAKGEFCENITRVGSVLGTTIYMAPEQITGGNPSKGSDIYSVGITLFEMAAGAPPFTKGNVSYQHIHVDPPAPSTRNSEIPAAFDSLVLKCLAKKPEDRYQDCRDLLSDLEKI